MSAPSDSELWSAAFRRDRAAGWRELDGIVTTIERKGLAAAGAKKLARLPALHRAALSALGVARSFCLDRNLLDYLESLAARAHLCVYGPRQSVPGAIRALLFERLPRAVRAAGAQLLIAFVALALGYTIAFTLCRADLDLFWHFVDDGRAQGRDPTATTADLRETLFDDGHGVAGLSLFAAWLWSHNSRVTLLAFGLSILGGLPGLLLVLVTGFELGAMSALFHDRGLAVAWWSWILPHGVTELLAVLLGCAAGLRLAHALIFPSGHGRLTALALRGREAGPLVFGAVAMLFLAGLIEGIFRQAVQEVPVRYALAVATGLFWLLWFSFCGRRAS